MKFTLKWLKNYLETDATIEQICEKLVEIGHEVESVEDRAAQYQNFIIGEVVECDQHPNADRLNICLVHTGTERLQVVCGAPNVAKGQKICFAPAGAVVPSNGMVLKATKIRDVESKGMICSESELCLTEESDGILVLPDDAPVGESFAEYMGFDDPVIDIDLTPNRPDCAGVRGIARDLAAVGVGRLKSLTQKNPVPGNFQSPISVRFDFSEEHKKACPIFIGRMIKNVQNGPSPKWLQDYLIAIGLRPVSALVDITNYFCIGLNRPLHVFDADKLQGDLVVRMSKTGELFDALDDKKYVLDDNQAIVISDHKGVAALGGVMGGERTGCTAETKNIFLESAYFDADYIRKTGQTMRIESDAKYRFERGVDPLSCAWGIEAATRLISDICGGQPSDLVTQGQAPVLNDKIVFDAHLVAKLGGVQIDPEIQTKILTSLGFDVTVAEDKKLNVIRPSWRPDIDGAVDLVEEILRIYGFDKIPTISVGARLDNLKSALTDHQSKLSKVKRLLASRGLYETVTWSFLDPKTSQQFKYDDKALVEIFNPLSEDLSIMRQSILPNLIKAVKNNHDRGYPNTAFFETGSVFWGQEISDQPSMIAGIRSGFHESKTWHLSEDKVDFYTIKADVLDALAQYGLNASAMPLSRQTPSWYHPGRSASLALGKKDLAYFGEVHPKILQELGIDFPVVGFEIMVDHFPQSSKKSTTKKFLKMSPFQPLYRDFSFIVDQEIEVAHIIKSINAADRKLITEVDIFDVYQGKGIEPNKKSIGVKIQIQPTDRTLIDDEIENLMHKVIETVHKKTGAVLRQ